MPDNIAPGFKTNEFWLTLAAMVFVALASTLQITQENVYIIVALSGAYTVGRSIVKK